MGMEMTKWYKGDKYQIKEKAMNNERNYRLGSLIMFVLAVVGMDSFFMLGAIYFLLWALYDHRRTHG
jgi:hypothetical protein